MLLSVFPTWVGDWHTQCSRPYMKIHQYYHNVFLPSFTLLYLCSVVNIGYLQPIHLSCARPHGLGARSICVPGHWDPCLLLKARAETRQQMATVLTIAGLSVSPPYVDNHSPLISYSCPTTTPLLTTSVSTYIPGLPGTYFSEIPPQH